MLKRENSLLLIVSQLSSSGCNPKGVLPSVQGEEKGCWGTAGDTARALPPADNMNMVPKACPEMECYQKLILNSCVYPGKEFALSRLGDAHNYFFSSPWAYRQHLCSTVVNAVKYSVHVWETNPFFTCFFFDKICVHKMTVITKL